MASSTSISTEPFERQKRYLFNPDLLLNGPVTPKGFLVRPVAIDDYEKGFMQVLSQLTDIGKVSRDEFVLRFKEWQAAPQTYYIIAIEELASQRVVAAGTLVIERKLIHSCGSCGHIEDIVVDSKMRGKNLGLLVIDVLKHLGKGVGCYKLVLDCKESNTGFYNKCGFKTSEVQMVLYYRENEKPLLSKL